MTMPNIILVEDDTSVSLLLSRQLQRSGFSVHTAGTLALARELFRNQPWDLAILDRGLPDGDGVDLCRELRARSEHGYIMLLTGVDSDEAKLEGFERGADDYITKPFQLDELVARIRAGVRIVQLQKALLDSNRRLEELSLTDSLTGIANRRAFDERYATAYETARRYERPLSLVFVDVDHFKAINDTQGHPTGDAVLHVVAQRIAAATRQTDFVARIGGEEFAILLPETPLFESIQFCEKIRATIASEDVVGQHVTVSLGVANMPHSHAQGSSELFNAADQALYRAKTNGRNRVEMERRRDLRPSQPYTVPQERRRANCSA
jgi:diguanylate cyclase (GGDEF)-like protein